MDSKQKQQKHAGRICTNAHRKSLSEVRSLGLGHNVTATQVSRQGRPLPPLQSFENDTDIYKWDENLKILSRIS